MAGIALRDTVAVLDFGGQYTHLIGRRIRQRGVYAKVLASETSIDELRQYGAIVLSGGPASVYETDAPKFDPRLFDLGIPVLGICYGMQAMAHALGGRVESGRVKEYGPTKIAVLEESRIFSGLQREQDVWMSHGDEVVDLPPGFDFLARSESGLSAAIGNKERRLYGVQFHPEVTHTPEGVRMLQNFVVDIAGMRENYRPENTIPSIIETIRKGVKDGYVLSTVSGGVDSTVATRLSLLAVLPERVYAAHLDHGFNRLDEAAYATRVLAELSPNFRIFDYSDSFLSAVGALEDPELKRNAIGDQFAIAWDDIIGNVLKLPIDKTYLVQGTLYTDRIESGHGVGRRAKTIKTHHNVGSKLIKKMRDEGRLVEPNDDWYKDEVREVGRFLGIPEAYLMRHPFPGPGLAIRTINQAQPDLPEYATRVDAKIRDAAKKRGVRGYLLPFRTVGVKGDHGSFDHAYMLKGGDYETVRAVAAEIFRDVPEVNCALWQQGGEDFEFAPLALDRPTLARHRLIDARMDEAVKRHEAYNRLAQQPNILAPGGLVIARPVITDDFMTVRPPRVPDEYSQEIFYDLERNLIRSGLARTVAMNITDKPPGTTEAQ